MCFKWAVLSGLYPPNDNLRRKAKYDEHENKVKWSGLDFPLSPKDAQKFERINPDVSVICLCGEKAEHFQRSPLLCEQTERARHVDLVLIQNYYVDEEGEEYHDDNVLTEPLRFHYVCIKDMSALIGTQRDETRNSFANGVCFTFGPKPNWHIRKLTARR